MRNLSAINLVCYSAQNVGCKVEHISSSLVSASELPMAFTVGLTPVVCSIQKKLQDWILTVCDSQVIGFILSVEK